MIRWKKIENETLRWRGDVSLSGIDGNPSLQFDIHETRGGGALLTMSSIPSDFFDSRSTRCRDEEDAKAHASLLAANTHVSILADRVAGAEGELFMAQIVLQAAKARWKS